MEKEFDVYGIGNPLIDLLSIVSDQILDDLNLNKGTMHLIDIDRRTEILDLLDEIKVAPGGSCANTIIALADFGLRVIYSGSVSNDKYGEQFKLGMIDKGCITDLKINSLPTGSSIILISEDTERTQNTYLGSCQQYNINDIDEGKIAKSKFLYFTGYMWDTDNQKEALKKAIKIAKSNSTKIIFDVADPFAVGRSKSDFIDLIKNDIDFVLANIEEAKMLTGKDKIDDVLSEIMKFSNSGVVKDGKNGSFIYKNGEIIEVDAFKVKAIDTTGAGDMYAAGIIYGLVRGYDMDRTGKIASFVAAKCVEIIGARVEISLREKIENI